MCYAIVVLDYLPFFLLLAFDYMVPIPDYNNLSPAAAIALQKEMQQYIDLQPLNKKIALIGGADISFNKFEKTVYAGIIVLSFPSLQPVHEVTIIAETMFPYISGLLAFREVPALVCAWHQLKLKPDVMVLDGQGIAHERRMGIATHFGILADVPAIGVAKSRLIGTYTEPENKQFAQAPLMHKSEQVGTVLRTKLNCKPLFVSPGHKTSLAQSVHIITTCVTKYRIPEPTRLAHQLVNVTRRSAMNARGGGTLF